MNTSAKGAAFERIVRKYLDAIDADLTIRSAASKGPFDIMAIHNGVILLVQCKASIKGASAHELRALELWGSKLSGYSFLRIVMVDKISGWRELRPHGDWLKGVSWKAIKSMVGRQVKESGTTSRQARG